MSRRRSGSWAARPLFLLFVGLDLNLWIDPTQCTEITVAWRRHATWEVPTRIEERRSPQSCKGGGGPNFACTWKGGTRATYGISYYIYISRTYLLYYSPLSLLLNGGIPQLFGKHVRSPPVISDSGNVLFCLSFSTFVLFSCWGKYASAPALNRVGIKWKGATAFWRKYLPKKIALHPAKRRKNIFQHPAIWRKNN